MEETQKSPMALRIEARMDVLGIPNPAQLAKKADVSRAVLTNIMRRPDKQLWVNIAIRLARALECRVEWMVEGIGPVTDDASEDFERLYGQSPMVELAELSGKDIKDVVKSSFTEADRLRYHCPVPTGENTVSIKANREIGRFHEDTILFIDLDNVTPRTGQMVLARNAGGGTPEFYTYSTSMNKKFIKAMTDDLPEELKFIEVTEDIEIIGSFVAAVIVRN